MARPIKDLEQIIKDTNLEEELLVEEIKAYNMFITLKKTRLNAVLDERHAAEHELKHHPDSMWDRANNAYEFSRDMEVSNGTN